MLCLLLLIPFSTRVASSPVLRNRTDNPPNEQLLFHGTNRFCSLGEDASKVRLCHLSKCRLCSVIRNSFDLKKCGSQLTFVHSFRKLIHALQVQNTSSVGLVPEYIPHRVLQVSDLLYRAFLFLPLTEADDYTLNGDENGRFKVLLVSRVVVGNPYKRRYNATDLAEPPCGHHSVSLEMFFCR